MPPHLSPMALIGHSLCLRPAPPEAAAWEKREAQGQRVGGLLPPGFRFSQSASLGPEGCAPGSVWLPEPFSWGLRQAPPHTTWGSNEK